MASDSSNNSTLQYIAKIKAMCRSNDPQGVDGIYRGVMMSGDHMVTLLDILQTMYLALEKCKDEHNNNGHQSSALDIVDKIIKEINNDKSKQH